MITPSIALIAALCAAPARAQSPSGRAASSQDIQTKVALESLLEKRLETVLRKMLGADDIFVVANAELLAESDRPDVEVLPGVTVKTTPATAAPLELPASLVKRITISVFVSKAATDAAVDLARKTTERMVGLKAERGDVLNVERVGAAGAAPAAQGPQRFLDAALHPRTLLLAVSLLVACWALVFVSRRFLDPFLGVLRDAAHALQQLSNPDREAVVEAHGAAENPAGPAAAEARVPEHAEADDRNIPFSFIREHDQPALELLLREQNELNSAIIIHYLPPVMASRLLSAMPAVKSETVLGHMSRAALMDQNEVRKLEEVISAKIDFIMGGEEKLASIIESSSITMQAAILRSVRQRNPELARKLEKRVVSMDDIGRLDEAGLTALSRLASVRGMAIVLKFVPGLREKVLPRLTSGLGDWLAQETALIGDLTAMVKETEMQKVLSALSKLVREGKVAVRNDPPPSTPPPAEGK
jgi:flagellar motor switch protein FliG